ncbi:hypothetical protein F5Y17DRAFT_454513 [Xylariaceae sp. FL0594]|nr:hypothetical protein F5Y17DRAFT_454513 [Xylariaceae sp. FL0594]
MHLYVVESILLALAAIGTALPVGGPSSEIDVADAFKRGTEEIDVADAFKRDSEEIDVADAF